MFANYQVRGQLVYSKAEDLHDSVERCINHQQKGKFAEVDLESHT